MSSLTAVNSSFDDGRGGHCGSAICAVNNRKSNSSEFQSFWLGRTLDLAPASRSDEGHPENFRRSAVYGVIPSCGRMNGISSASTNPTGQAKKCSALNDVSLNVLSHL
jgi:hypothetical protein